MKLKEILEFAKSEGFVEQEWPEDVLKAVLLRFFYKRLYSLRENNHRWNEYRCMVQRFSEVLLED